MTSPPPPAWDEVAAAALPERHVHAPSAEAFARLSPVWERYRETRRSGASRPLEMGALLDFVDEVTLTLDDYQAGRALDALSAWFREGGYTEQCCLLQDRALGIVAAQSPRRHADMLLDAIETYGARVKYGQQGNIGDFSESERVGPLYLAWVQFRLPQYFALTREPRSLVSPGDLLQRAREYYEHPTQRFWLARPFFEAACDGDLARLPERDVLKYSWTLAEGERAEVLAGLRARNEPGGVAEWLVLVHMTSALLAAGDLDAAAEACQALQDSEGPLDSKQSAAVRLARHFWDKGDAEAGLHWASQVLQRGEEGAYAAMARRLIERIKQGKSFFIMPWEEKE